MREVGVDIAGRQPKLLTTEAVRASDYVITMGCGDACPVFPGKQYLDYAPEDRHKRFGGPTLWIYSEAFVRRGVHPRQSHGGRQ